jgi:hypothetical protein
MFSFFKFLQNTIKDLKKKKGLWFSILAFLSIVGIFLSLFILMSMTDNVSKEVYASISSNYSKNYKNKVNKKELNFKKLAVSIKSNTQFLDNIVKNDFISVSENMNIYNDNFKNAGFLNLELKFYPVANQVNQYRNSINAVINSKTSAFGIEILLDGVFYVQIEPLIIDDKIIGIIELKEKVHNLKAEYTKDDVIFLFLLEERMLNKLSIKSRNGKYKEVLEKMNVEELKYNGQFVGKIIESGKEKYKQMLEIGYDVDDTFFRTTQKISDINGHIIGVIVLGERVADSGAFVNIVDSMTKTVTTVALGLVISILLFMF